MEAIENNYNFFSRGHAAFGISGPDLVLARPQKFRRAALRAAHIDFFVFRYFFLRENREKTGCERRCRSLWKESHSNQIHKIKLFHAAGLNLDRVLLPLYG